MQRGMKPFRVYSDDEAAYPIDLEARDESDARVRAAELINGDHKVAEVTPLDPDEVRDYEVLVLPPVVHRNSYIRAKSSIEAMRIADAEISMGKAPLAAAVNAEAVSARPVL